MGDVPLLAEVRDVEVMLGRLLSDDEVERVSAFLAMTSTAVRRHTHQTLSEVKEHEVTVSSTGSSVLVLAERPVTDVSLVVLHRAEILPPYFTWDSFGHLTRLDGWPWGLRYDPITVVYTHGWNPIPDDVVGLVAAKVAGFLTTSAVNPGGLRALQVGAMSETYSNAAGTDVALGPGALTRSEREALTGYRLGSIAAQIGTH